ncbi:MAG: NAD-dependent epimerase/dehydratase family protein [Lachnospiraceae bacterium]|nr:NAD-dependent epimerase/dehydratase family protein [Lachnospiraceae bacterium]
MADTVLVLGGSYFVGRKLVEFLAESGYAVTVLNRGTRPLSVEGVQQICCDRNDGGGMKKALAGKAFDYVIDVSWQDVSWVEKLCDALSFESVKKLVFISSSAVYDVERLQIPFAESDALAENKCWTFYGKGKIDAEKYYADILKDKQTELVMVRPPYIYGEYNYAQRESLIFRQLMEDKPVVIPASNPRLQFIYTEDLAAIVECLLKSETGKVSVFNVGNRTAVTSKEWVEVCAKVAGKVPEILEADYETLGRTVRDFYPFFDYDNVLEVSKINGIISRETDFEEGLKKSFAWFLENRGNIVFKENVDKNLYEMIAELSV